MAHALRPVEPGFDESAPLRLVFTAEVSAPPDAVYRALADDVAGWTAWFGAVTTARPTQDGAGRFIRLTGGIWFDETIMAADPGERYAYRVDRTNAPGVSALMEVWRLTPAPGGTRVRWVFAVDAPSPVRALLRLARPGLAASFRGAVRSLDRRLAGSASW